MNSELVSWIFWGFPVAIWPLLYLRTLLRLHASKIENLKLQSTVERVRAMEAHSSAFHAQVMEWYQRGQKRNEELREQRENWRVTAIRYLNEFSEKNAEIEKLRAVAQRVLGAELDEALKGKAKPKAKGKRC